MRKPEDLKERMGTEKLEKMGIIGMGVDEIEKMRKR
jgi:hypothetical protein